jgi:hypothetical protein
MVVPCRYRYRNLFICIIWVSLKWTVTVISSLQQRIITCASGLKRNNNFSLQIYCLIDILVKWKEICDSWNRSISNWSFHSETYVIKICYIAVNTQINTYTVMIFWIFADLWRLLSSRMWFSEVGMEYVPLKCWYPFISPHGVTSQKTVSS